ncbi:hypothetical protein MTP99_000214 [Tenebrio molitor]|nr:hypothetical protein MTP99_000214 [Tenebrio molitor]
MTSLSGAPTARKWKRPRRSRPPAPRSVFTRPWRAWRDSTGAAYFDAACSFEGVGSREETELETLPRRIPAPRPPRPSRDRDDYTSASNTPRRAL